MPGKKTLKIFLGIGVLIVAGIIMKLTKTFFYFTSPQDFASCMQTCTNPRDQWYADVDCSEYCTCVAREPRFSDVCIDFRVGKPDVPHKVKITADEAAAIATSTPEMQEFFQTGESNKVAGVVGPMPYHCINRQCDYKYIVDHAYDINGRTITPWSKKTGPAVMIDIDASTGTVVGRYSRLRDPVAFTEYCKQIYGANTCE